MLPSGFLTGQLDFPRLPFTTDEFKILAKVSRRLIEDQIGAAFAALLGHAWVIALAIHARAQIGATFHADLAATRVAIDRPRFAALVTMTGHGIADFRSVCPAANCLWFSGEKAMDRLGNRGTTPLFQPVAKVEVHPSVFPLVA
jgi:hypothetical protein